MNMLKWLKSIFTSPRYRIVHDPRFGYAPQYDDGVLGWCIIESSGTVGVSHIYCADFPAKWCKTYEDAGARVNGHATSHGQSVVWVAP